MSVERYKWLAPRGTLGESRPARGPRGQTIESASSPPKCCVRNNPGSCRPAFGVTPLTVGPETHAQPCSQSTGRREGSRIGLGCEAQCREGDSKGRSPPDFESPLGLCIPRSITAKRSHGAGFGFLRVPPRYRRMECFAPRFVQDLSKAMAGARATLRLQEERRAGEFSREADIRTRFQSGSLRLGNGAAAGTVFPAAGRRLLRVEAAVVRPRAPLGLLSPTPAGRVAGGGGPRLLSTPVVPVL